MRFDIRQLLALVAAVALPAAALAAPKDGTIVGEVRIRDKGGDRGDRSGIVIWVEGVAAKPKPAREKMSSQKKAFTPGLLVVPKGSTVEFPNIDPIFHNVFSVSKAKRFDLGLYKSGASKDVVMDQVGVVKVYCNIHSAMTGTIVVTDGPFAITDADGRFRIPGLPPGDYTIHAWDDKAGEVTQAVTVASGENPTTVSFDASGFVVKPHLNKYGKPYPKGGSDERY